MTYLLSVDELNDYVGKEIGLSDWIEIDQKCINEFAKVTRDSQFIHVDPERAKLSPFGGTIAHGFLTLSFLSSMLFECGITVKGATVLINYGFDKVRFLTPVSSGARVRGKFSLKEAVERNTGQILLTYHVVVEIENVEKPALICDWLGLQILED